MACCVVCVYICIFAVIAYKYDVQTAKKKIYIYINTQQQRKRCAMRGQLSIFNDLLLFLSLAILAFFIYLIFILVKGCVLVRVKFEERKYISSRKNIL